MGHRSGVIGPRTRMHWAEAADWDAVCGHIAAAEPWWEPGTAQGYHMVTFGFILGEVVRRVTGRTIGQYLRTEIAEPLGIDVHIGLPHAEHHRCAEMVNKPHIRDVLADGEAPGYPASLAEHPMAGLSVAMGFVPDDELGSNELARWRRAEFPATNAHVTALGMATFYNALAQEKLLSRDHMELVRVSQGGFDTDVVLGRAGRRSRLGPGLHAQPARRRGPEPADVRPRRLRRLVRVRRPRAPHRLRVRDELLRRHQMQRRPAQRGALRRGLLRSRRNSRLVRRLFRAFPVCTLDAMNGVLLVLVVVVIAAIGVAVYAATRASDRRNAASLEDAKADARRVIERLGGQVINLTGSDDASKQALADASERYTAAGSQIEQATTAKQALLAKESAIEGLYYVRAARAAMGMDPGPELETLAGQRSAGAVTEDRRVDFEGREIEASPGRRSAPRTTTPAVGSPAARFRRAGTPSRGGSRRWWPAPGVSVGTAVRRDVLRHARSRIRRKGFERATATATRGLAAGQDGGGRRRRRLRRRRDGGGDGGGGWDSGGWDGGGGDWRRRRLRRRRLRRLLALETALQTRRDPGLLQVESFEHCAHRFILDVAGVAFRDQRRTLTGEHVAVERGKHLRHASCAPRGRASRRRPVNAGRWLPDLGEHPWVHLRRAWFGTELRQHLIGGVVHHAFGFEAPRRGRRRGRRRNGTDAAVQSAAAGSSPVSTGCRR